MRRCATILSYLRPLLCVLVRIMDSIISLRDYCRTEREWLLETIETLVRLESPTTDKAAVDRCGAELMSRLEAIGGRVTKLPRAERGDHVLAEFGCGASQLLVLGHFDTVWPVGQLERMPLVRRDGKLHGPGIFDMKAGVVQLLFALAAVGERGGLDGVTLVLTTDEEIGSPSSRDLLAEEAKGVRAALIPEPSFAGALKTERKGVALYRLEAVGRAAHAGLDPEQGINAALEVARQVLEVAELAEPSAGTTVTPSLISAGTASNTVPASAVAHFDVRFATREEGERIAAAFAAVRPRIPGASTSVQRETFVPPLERSSSRELFELAHRLQGELGLPPLREASVGGGSDGNHIAALGVPTLDGLGAVGDHAHGEGECVVVSAMAERAALLAALVSELLSA